jgi:ATP-dependent Clp protease ATP-binding subunit ClpB
MQLEIEREALKKETDAAARDRLKKLEKELASCARARRLLAPSGRREGRDPEAPQVQGGDRPDEAGDREGRARVRSNKVRSCAYGKLAQLEKELAAAEQKLSAGGGARLLKEQVDEEDIAEVVARWDRHPGLEARRGRAREALQLEEHLHQRVIGQDEAVVAVANAVLARPAGIKDPNRPIGSFIFLGRPAWARPSWRARSPSSCSTASRR